MGGGGGYFSGRDVERHVQQVQSGSDQRNAEYDLETNEFLRGLVSEFNDRDVDGIRDYLDEIAETLEEDTEGTIELRFGGSIAKHTYVDGMSDVDALVCLSDSDLVEGTPQAAKQHLYDKLRDALSHADISVGDLAVTVRYGDAEVQLLPAVREGERFRISSASGDRWSAIDPSGFASKLTSINQQNGGKVVPVIKLAKALMAKFPEHQRVSGYHAEALAVDVFKSYDGSFSPKAMLKHYFRKAADRVLEPIRDSTGQSIHVDDALGESNSLQRQVVASAFARTARRMDLADAGARVSDWRALFDEME